MKAECFHWLGKARDLADKPAVAQYLLSMNFSMTSSARSSVYGVLVDRAG